MNMFVFSTYLKEKKKAFKSQGSLHTNIADQDGDDSDAVSDELAKGFLENTRFSKRLA